MPERLNRIKEVLVIVGMSQKELAERWGKTENQVSRVCNNLSQPPLPELKIIAEILDVDIKDLIVSTKPNG